MFVDICIPKDNEEKFVLIAEKLGIRGILFLYEKKEKNLSELKKKTKVKIWTGLITEKTPGTKHALVFSPGHRHLIENKNISFHYGFETLEEGKDHLHYRKSGANQATMKIMKQKNKVLVISIEAILESKNQSKTLGRIKQNLMLAKKQKIPLITSSFATKPENMRGEEEQKALIRVLGTQEQAKNAVKHLHETLLKEKF
jgi:RNase P/RNase MRP subunit p30